MRLSEFKPDSFWRPTSLLLLVLVLALLPLAHPVQVNLVDDPHRHHDPDHGTERRAEDPHGLRRSAHHRAVRGSIWAQERTEAE